MFSGLSEIQLCNFWTSIQVSLPYSSFNDFFLSPRKQVYRIITTIKISVLLSVDILQTISSIVCYPEVQLTYFMYTLILFLQKNHNHLQNKPEPHFNLILTTFQLELDFSVNNHSFSSVFHSPSTHLPPLHSLLHLHL